MKNEGKDILLARHLKDKESYAVAIIASALAASAGAAFIPGSAAYITAIQVAAIMGLYYLYTGNILSKTHALGLLPTFVGRSIGTNIFLWVKSVLPPTGVLDAAAAGIALVITFAMLGAVKSLLENGYSLDDTDILKSNYDLFKTSGNQLTNISLSDLADKEKLMTILKSILSKKA